MNPVAAIVPVPVGSNEPPEKKGLGTTYFVRGVNYKTSNMDENRSGIFRDVSGCSHSKKNI
jgi:hypothetical protein